MCGYVCIGPPQEDILLGEVTSLDPSGTRVEVSIGSDDGLVRGQRLSLLRGWQPGDRCIGEVRIVSLDCDRSVGEIVENWASRRPVARVGDLVSTKLGIGGGR
jgi:hypothetical protein